MSRDSFDRLMIALGIAAAATAMVGGPFTGQVLMWIATNALLAASLRFVMLIGEFNIAVVAFYAIGAYSAAIATAFWKLPLAISLLSGGVIAAIAAVAFGYGTMRLKGPYFMLISFAFAEVLRLIITKTDAVGGNNGVVGIYPPRWLEAYFPALTIGVVVLLLLLMYLIERSHHGKIFAAIRSNDAIVKSVGINLLGMKVLCLVISAFAAGLGGALYSHANNVISPGDFSFFVAVFALAFVKIGGESDPAGPVLGAIVLTLLGQFMLRFGQLESLFYGAAIVVAMLVLPDGVLGLLVRFRVLAPVRGRSQSKKRIA